MATTETLPTGHPDAATAEGGVDGDERRALVTTQPIASASDAMPLQSGSRAAPGFKPDSMNMNAGFFESFRELQLLTEFKRLANKAPNGVYAMPSLESMQVWSGVIIVHEGMYKDAIFKFTLSVPDEYPSVAPRVRFISNVYHPLVGASGEFDVGRFFSPWVPGKHHISDALVLIKRIFYHLDKVDARYVKNKLAYEVYQKDVSVFQAAVKACVLEAIDNKYDNFPNESVFKFKKWDDHIHSKALQAILGSTERDGQAGDGIYGWVTSSIGSFSQWFTK